MISATLIKDATAELNRSHHILKLFIKGKELCLFDTALGNPKGWKSKFEYDGYSYDIEYRQSDAEHYVVIYPYISKTLKASVPIEIKLKITDNLAHDLGKLIPKAHVYGEAIKQHPKHETFTPKFKVDGVVNGVPYRFIEDENGTFEVNGTRCMGFPLEIEADYTVHKE